MWYDILSAFIGRWWGLISLLTWNYIEVWKQYFDCIYTWLMKMKIMNTNYSIVLTRKSQLILKYINFHHAGVGMQSKLRTEGCCISPTFHYLSMERINNIAWSSWSDFIFSPLSCSPCVFHIQKWQKLFIQTYSYQK